MENPVFALFIFVLCLFIYIHITSSWKTSNDLEIYEADYESPQQLQEICQVKQPVLFQIKNRDADDFSDKFRASQLEKYDNHDVCLKDQADYLNTSREDSAVDYVLLSLRSARRLLSSDTKAQYFIEGNQSFLEESGLEHLAQTMDPYLKPPLSAYTKHDILLGSPGATTPLRYRLETHQYLATTSGKIRVKLCPPKYTKFLPLVKDYENYEFRSTVQVWKTPNSTESKTKDAENSVILSKIKLLDVDVAAGEILYIPAYWWYSVKFSGDANTTVAGFIYDNAVNIAAQANHWALYYLQQNNIKTRVAKTHPVIASEEVIPEVSESSPNSDPIIIEPRQEVHTSSGEHRNEIITNAGIYAID